MDVKELKTQPHKLAQTYKDDNMKTTFFKEVDVLKRLHLSAFDDTMKTALAATVSIIMYKHRLEETYPS